MPQSPIPLFSWIFTKWKGSLRLRHTILLSGIILLLMGFISFIMLSVQRSTLHEAAEAKGLAFTEAFALGGWAAIHKNLFRIQEALLEYSQDPDIRGIEVIDKDNMIIAAQIPQQIGLILEDQQWLDMKKQNREVIQYAEGPTGEQLLITVAPLVGKNKIEAWIRVIFSLEDLRREEDQLVIRMTLITMILIVTGILGVQWAQKQVSTILQKVIANLQDALPTMKAPNETVGTEESRSTEDLDQTKLVRGDIENLGETVTETVVLLKTQSEALRESTQFLEQKVMDRTADLMESKRSLEKEISERKQAEEAMQQAKLAAESANRAKSNFLASMSHELRTPLNGILGYAQILKRDPELSVKQKSRVDVIQQSGDHLLNLITDILDLSKIEAQKLELQLTEFHLPDFLQQIANIIRVRAEQAELSFEYEAVSDIPTWVRGDEKRMRQVLLNLLGNAVKFTEKGGVVLKVGYDDSSDGSRLLRFQVEDTGRGIPQDQLGEIFQPFQQVSDHRRPVEGTGLGLSITKKLVGLMGGELGVTSVPEQGSTFWFTVDLPAGDVEQVAAHPVERMIAGYKGERKRILIADDKEANRGIIVNLLEPVGFEVQEAVNGEDCLANATKHPPHLILMDLLMPVMDGIEATRRIRQLPDLKDVVIIASSASVFEFNQKDSRTAGCNDFLMKPVRFDQLFEKLRTNLALEWVYESEPSHEETVPADSSTLVAPPAEEMKTLVDLVGKGKIIAIRQRITEIEQMGEEYRPFAAELNRLAKSFDMDQLTKFLNPYLEKTE